MHVHKQNVQHCPATFKMVEKLMARINGGKILVEQDGSYK